MVTRSAASVLAIVDRVDFGQVQLRDDIEHEEGQVPLRQPTAQVRRQKQLLVDVVRQVSLGHFSQT